MPNEPAHPEPKDLRAADADRERVAQILHDAVGEGRLTVTEADDRLKTVYAAKTLGELEPVTADLPVPSPMSTAPDAQVHDSRIGGTPDGSTAISIMGGAERRGNWVVPRQFNAVSIMGGVDLDLTQARFAARETTITVFALMAGVDIIVPDDVEVHVRGVGLMGAFEDMTRKRKHDDSDQSPPPGAPIVIVNGVALMAGVEVKRPKRKKKDRKQLPD